jgi:adenosine deaminase
LTVTSSKDPYVQLPKAELHAHLNGCVPTVLVRELSRQFHDEMTAPVAGLASYLLPWEVFRTLPSSRARLRVLVDAAVELLAADSVRYAELRNSVCYIAELNATTVAEALAWLLDAFDAAAARHGVDVRLVVPLRRDRLASSDLSELYAALRAKADHLRLVGVDLAGDEQLAGRPADAAAFLRRCREELGLGVTIHAGEAGGAANVRWGVQACGAQRIGHGLSAIDDPAVVELLRAQDICVEVCLTSNLLSQAVTTMEQHPVGVFLAQDVPFVLCADNPALHGRGLSHEYAEFAAVFGAEPLERMFKRQLRYAFASVSDSAAGR